MIRLSILLACTAITYIAIRWPLWVLAAFAVSWGSVLVADCVAWFQGQRRAKGRVELPEMRLVN